MSSIFLVIIGLSTFFAGYKIYSKFLARNIFDIYDKTVSVYESFIKANQSLDLAKTKMDEARQRLQEGSGSLTKKVEKMKKLGRLSTKKQLPDSDDDVIG